jgi:integrase
VAETAIRGAGKFKPKDLTKLTLTKAGTINRELATLRHLRNMAVRWGWTAPSAHRVRVLPDEPTKTAYLSVEECKSLLDCARADANPLIYPFVFIGLETSMRLSEILSIRHEHVDVAGRAIFIPKAKAGARQQPMTGRLAAYLETYLASLPEKAGWLFPSASSKTGHIEDIRKPFVRVVSAAGLDPRVITPHVMRHTAITHAIQAGVDLPTVQKMSGHKTLAMVGRYAHSSAPHVQEAMNKLEARYKEAA